MKRINQVILALALLGLLIGSAFSQDNEGSYYTITTWKIDVPQDGSRKEFNELMKEWYDKITSKNDKIISERILRHSSGSDQRDVVIITEYASWNDIEAAQKKQNELIDAAWDKDGRQAFFKKFNKYSLTHSDEIYQEYPNWRK